jgi:small RNA 2'-O-methyltransferase
MASELHEERLDTVVRYLLDSGAARVLDLGCASGDLLLRLAGQPQFTRIVGIDIDEGALAEARAALMLNASPHPGDAGRVRVQYGSFEEADHSLLGFDAAALVETIEHIDPRRLSRVEDAVFRSMRPCTVLVTTPNQEYNILHGLAPGQRRHPGHRFEWTRERFRQWSRGVAARHGYRVDFIDIGPVDPQHGSTTQMARFNV